jgi:hypothetical protein
MKHTGQNFRQQEIHMDFNQFINCVFDGCLLIYHGYGAIHMEGCSFINVRWTFADAAANTVSFMAALYTGAGEGGKKLIDSTFDTIKKGPPSGNRR